MFQDFRFEGYVIFENSTLIKSWPLKSVSLFYIDIRFPSSVSEGHSIDIRFCIHDLIKEDDWSDHPCTNQKKKSFLHHMHHVAFALHALIHSLHIIKMILIF